MILVRLVQPSKALSRMLVTLSGNVMFVRLSHQKKAKRPMLVTLSGIVMLVRLAQSQKAETPMLVTGLPSMVSGITSSPEAAVLQSVMVTLTSVVV